MIETIFGFDINKQWDYENGFYLTSHLTRIPKMLAHYELYKSIVHLPGHIVECGVFKGASLMRFCTFREVLESPFSRKVIGFDAFGSFPHQEDAIDQEFAQKFEGAAGEGISVEELTLALTNKSFLNYELIQGDVVDKVPAYVNSHPELKIALLHIDVDVYKPSTAVLSNLFDKVVSGGLIIFDDYGTVAGETKAVDEFFADKNLVIEKMPISHIPSFVRKS